MPAESSASSARRPRPPRSRGRPHAGRRANTPSTSASTSIAAQPTGRRGRPARPGRAPRRGSPRAHRGASGTTRVGGAAPDPPRSATRDRTIARFTCSRWRRWSRAAARGPPGDAAPAGRRDGARALEHRQLLGGDAVLPDLRRRASLAATDARARARARPRSPRTAAAAGPSPRSPPGSATSPRRSTAPRGRSRGAASSTGSARTPPRRSSPARSGADGAAASRRVARPRTPIAIPTRPV